VRRADSSHPPSATTPAAAAATLCAAACAGCLPSAAARVGQVKSICIDLYKDPC